MAEEWVDIDAPVVRAAESLADPYALLVSLPSVNSISRTDDPDVFQARCLGMPYEIRVCSSTGEAVEYLSTPMWWIYRGMASETVIEAVRRSAKTSRVTLRGSIRRPLWNPMAYTPTFPALQVHLACRSLKRYLEQGSTESDTGGSPSRGRQALWLVLWFCLGALGAVGAMRVYDERGSQWPWLLVAGCAMSLAWLLRRSRYVTHTAWLTAVPFAGTITIWAATADAAPSRPWFAAIVVAAVAGWFAAVFLLASYMCRGRTLGVLVSLVVVAIAAIGPMLLGVDEWSGAAPDRVQAELQLTQMRLSGRPNFDLFLYPADVNETWREEPVDYGSIHYDGLRPSYLQAFPASPDGAIARIWHAFGAGKQPADQPEVLSVEARQVLGAYPGYEVRWVSGGHLGRTHIASTEYGLYEATAYTPIGYPPMSRPDAADALLDDVVLGPWTRGEL